MEDFIKNTLIGQSVYYIFISLISIIIYENSKKVLRISSTRWNEYSRRKFIENEIDVQIQYLTMSVGDTGSVIYLIHLVIKLIGSLIGFFLSGGLSILIIILIGGYDTLLVHFLTTSVAIIGGFSMWICSKKFIFSLGRYHASLEYIKKDVVKAVGLDYLEREAQRRLEFKLTGKVIEEEPINPPDPPIPPTQSDDKVD